jgi:N-acetylneuraminic acid mutarotase
MTILLILGGCRSQPEMPEARYGAKMVFDSLESQSIMFGGRAEGLIGLKYFDDLWAFDSVAQTWARIETADRPGGRLSPGMVYDPVHHQIILFGGNDKQDRLGDTWVYSISDNHWEEVTPENGPPPRSDGGMVYDEENQIVILFGGYCQEESRSLCDDTWSYDPITNIWTEMNPPSSPPIMYGHTLVYDDANHRVVLWGGHMSSYRNGQIASAGYGDSIWTYDYLENVWRQTEHTRKPPARYWHQAIFDTKDDNLLLFGGNGGRGFLNDTWFFDVERDSWESANTELAPTPRVNPAMTYDSIRNVTILFGGLEEDMSDLRDTWVFEETDTGGEWTEITPAQRR